MQDKQVALITGANKGIGLQIAKDLAKHGLTVLVGSRNLENGERAAKSIGEGARALQLDVTDSASIVAAADLIRNEFGRLDVLVNNAGITSVVPPGTSFEERMKTNIPSSSPLDNVRGVFETNVFGVIAVTQAMLPLLREAPAGRIVNLGSSSGSLTLNSNPSYEYRHVFGAAYSPSKTALHAISLAFALELEKTNIKVNVACPGYTATDLNNFRGIRTVEQGAREAVRLALLGPDGPTGTFSDEDGPVSW
ncbi:SDR family oxidoreductase [Granulicella mallensis]|uniref:3-oxoacyl-(Acyl-carrier-protein) reductase n=1 Tax=Granulicella mallensis (strain ATCC BAA-1857 / DSM 23137 / MP5ACTX8) TaxID=682795 RepID=G8NUA5_GRAMM|nr:SDR family oxidoreductase [Granulicella mallensis]AEU35261.1 3-oxoacyl-(acyl-carrier-protein) reductase [Granulicella mallensis MP5ACTX8]